jgi:FAD/FMN-containing dehydrogenase
MHRRTLLKHAATIPLLASALSFPQSTANAESAPKVMPRRRVRPGDPAWPSEADWARLNGAVGGRLIKVQTPLAMCRDAADSAVCRETLKNLRNPFFISEQPWATQSSGWLDAWMSAPSAYAVTAESAADVAAAVNFARERNLRLVIKGGGHSFQGTSCAPDSLLIWTRRMNRIVLRDAFVPQGCAGQMVPQPAVEIGAGAIWLHVYEAVTGKAGRFVRGGGCTTVGVAGLVQSGGFGNFFKKFGTAAGSLLEAEIVTADGQVRTGNQSTNPDLFWAVKGGGGGTFGVVTKLVLKTYELPEAFGSAQLTVKAASDESFRRLIRQFLDFYRDQLLNPHWDGLFQVRHDNTLAVSMISQGLDPLPVGAAWHPFLEWPASGWDKLAAGRIWRPFLGSIAASPQDYSLVAPPTIASMPARDWWNADFRRAHGPSAIVADDRPGALRGDFWWAGDDPNTGAFWHGFSSTWLSASLLQADQAERLSDALFAASRYWSIELQPSKGLAGAADEALAAARETATNPAVLDAFALAIIAGRGPPAYPEIAGDAPDLTRARRDANLITLATAELRKLAPNPGSYVSESDFFEKDWQHAFWGDNYSRLRAVKAKYDPDGLFCVHHGVGSEDWSTDGFTRLAEQ